ncbi:MAG: helix-turn-helix domain-containing protein [Nitrospinaceae bacterium]
MTNFLGDRLRKWRKSLPLKSYELARLISISQGSLSDIENNKSLPSADTIAKLYRNTNINIVWLLTGKGPMTKGRLSAGAGTEEMEAPMAHEEFAEYGLNQNLKDMIEKLLRIYKYGDPEKRAHLLGFLAGADPGDTVEKEG